MDQHRRLLVESEVEVDNPVNEKRVEAERESQTDQWILEDNMRHELFSLL